MTAMQALKDLSTQTERYRHGEFPETTVDRLSISVIGLGYVGAVTLGCLANLGFHMYGADIIEKKSNAVNAGRSTVDEEGLGDLLRDSVARGLVQASTDVKAAIRASDMTFLCVGTPEGVDAADNFDAIRHAARTVGEVLAEKDGYHVVVVRSSAPPGTTMNVVVPILEEASGKSLNTGFGVCFNPQFLREGVAVADFYAPSKTVIGASDHRAAAMLASVYRLVDDRILMCNITAAEMVKYIDNVWHATKVTFANEVGRLCKAVEIDSHEVMNIFVQDQKLNLSPYYLKPGFAFGGSCLPQEVRAIEDLAKSFQIQTPLFQSILASNAMQIEEGLRMIRKFPGKRIGFLGVAFKCDSDDLRDSPALELMAALLNDGTGFSAFDPSLRISEVSRGHFEDVRRARPKLNELLDYLPKLLRPNLEEVIAESDVLVISHNKDYYRQAVLRRPKGTHVIDLVRLFKDVPDDPTYHGISW